MLCRHVPLCGGCRWQQDDYTLQLQRKQALIEEIFAPLGALPVHPILPCATPWRYRNKMEFSFSQNKAGDHFLGLMMARGRVLNLEECLITSPWFAETLGHVRSWWKESGLRAFHPYSNTGSLRTLTLREGQRTQQKMAILTVSGHPDFALNREQISGYVAAVQKSGLASIFLCIQQQQKGSPTQFYELHLAGPDHITETMQIAGRHFTFKISPRSFFQPNPAQAEQLYTRALEMCRLRPDMHVLDLYCGTATLAMVFAPHVKKVSAIELVPEAILDAESNLRTNKLENVALYCGDVGKMLAKINEPPDLVIVDPPRAGLSDEALSQIVQLAPKEILYISCNPLTQAANAQKFLEAGYKIKEVQPVDQFPHTPHIENIVILSCP